MLNRLSANINPISVYLSKLTHVQFGDFATAIL